MHLLLPSALPHTTIIINHLPSASFCSNNSFVVIYTSIVPDHILFPILFASSLEFFFPFVAFLRAFGLKMDLALNSCFESVSSPCWEGLMPSCSRRPQCIIVLLPESPSSVKNIKVMLKQSSCKVLYMPVAEQQLCRRRNKEVRAHLASAGLEGELSFGLTLQIWDLLGERNASCCQCSPVSY